MHARGPIIGVSEYGYRFISKPYSLTHILNVLHLIQQNQLRGAEVFAAQLVRELKSSSTSRHTLVAIREGSNGAGSVSSIVDIQSLVKQAPGALGVVSEIRSLRRCIADLRPDVLVAHGAGTLKLGVLATLWGARPRIVYRNIGIASFWAGDWKRRNFNKFLLKRISGVVSVSEFTARDFSDHYGFPGDRIVPIPNGVEGENFISIEHQSARARLRSELGVETDTLLIVSVGSLSLEKGPADLVESVSALRSAGTDAHLVLIGVGPLNGELESIARKGGVAEKVHFLGARDDVPAILRGSDIYVLTSKSEGMPAVLIEAGMAGLPTVAYGVGAVDEVVVDGETGIIVAPGDFAALVAGLSDLATDSEKRSAQGNDARARCFQKFEMAKVASSYDRMFECVVAGRSLTG